MTTIHSLFHLGLLVIIQQSMMLLIIDIAI